jgi:hypothetical protein
MRLKIEFEKKRKIYNEFSFFYNLLIIIEKYRFIIICKEEKITLETFQILSFSALQFLHDI